MKKKDPPTVQTNCMKTRATSWRLSPRFYCWFVKEKQRRGMTTWGLLEELALSYILSRKEASKWPMD